MNPAPLNNSKKRTYKRYGARKPMRILVTAGPTREFIDPVRFISNLSTGNMGYALAKVAQKRAHRVTLISGPVNPKPPKDTRIICVVTANGMFKAVKRQFKNTDCLIMSAAVCDFRPKKVQKHKIKKKGKRKLSLIRNPDILSWAGKNKAKRLIVGFCVETEKLIERAKQKLKTKNIDIIVANRIGKHNLAFGGGPTRVSILDKNGSAEKIGPENKEKIAQILLDKIEGMWYK